MSATEKNVKTLTPNTSISSLNGKALVMHGKQDGEPYALDGDTLKTTLDNKTPLHHITLGANTGLVLYGSVLVSVVGGLEASITQTFLINTEDDGGWVALLSAQKYNNLEEELNFYFDDDWQLILWAESTGGGIQVTVCDLDGNFRSTLISTKPTNKIAIRDIANSASIGHVVLNNGAPFSASAEAEAIAATEAYAGNPKITSMSYWFKGTNRGVGNGELHQNIYLTNSNTYENMQILTLGSKTYKRIISLALNGDGVSFEIVTVGSWAQM